MILQPAVHRFVVFEVSSGDPFVFWPITAPPYEVLEVIAEGLAIYYLVHHVFGDAIYFNRARFFDSSSWECLVVVRLEGLDVGGMEGWKLWKAGLICSMFGSAGSLPQFAIFFFLFSFFFLKSNI